MASRRKAFTPPPRTQPDDRQTYAAFMRALLAGTVVATALIETQQGPRKTLEYDDPNG